MAKISQNQPQVPNMLQLAKKAEFPTFFADYIESRTSGEEVILTFCRRDYDNPLKTAIPIARIYLTIPHYYRFGKLVNENIQRIIEKGIIAEEEVKSDSNS